MTSRSPTHVSRSGPTSPPGTASSSTRLGVLRRRQVPPMRRHDDPPLDLVGWRHQDRGDVERAAVDQQTMPGAAEDRRQLVEDPRRYLPGGVLGGAAQLGEREGIGSVGPERQRHRDLEGGTGRQADALGQVGRDSASRPTAAGARRRPRRRSAPTPVRQRRVRRRRAACRRRSLRCRCGSGCGRHLRRPVTVTP